MGIYCMLGVLYVLNILSGYIEDLDTAWETTKYERKQRLGYIGTE
jgi:hypothetical protein